ncbi:GntR family transcriptional regulator [Synoicihabitans lomoniglobus]|uniref:GntR family transcriptional regulator n=1 Tax=Synoicihabitans lomoniglobus TaxID=2909285 RepID=A0AAF0I3H1_9BACT|nr:GntR family transcriptional regulator [Opitutaceae bacterium LMO-M01]
MPPDTSRAPVKTPDSPPESAEHLGAQILTRLRERVLNWDYPPGHHLGEVALCAEFSASRIPVREALRALAEQGLVKKVPNQGCFVIQPDVIETQDLYDMRLALELFVVEMLASSKPPPPEWLDEQRAFWEPWLQVKADAVIDRDMLVDHDTEFHLGLAEVLGNESILGALRNINERLRFVRLAAITNPHRIQETAGEHLSVLDALTRSDAEAARRSLRQNIHHSRNKVEIAISRALMAAHDRRRSGKATASPAA